ncbi:PQQ-binding-like beta-propeller repeat protein [Streptomyces roseoviridis]|uniref:PQQ-binding-like beta-propeller repeat protein n=1 Tax=Streptomyces roseoviridis TaxID=67361 RepID=A0ABV5QNH4_9ACTN
MGVRTAAGTAAVLLSGAAFGAAAVLLGGFVVRGLGEMRYECTGSLPDATVWWWLLTGAALLAAGRLTYVRGTAARRTGPREASGPEPGGDQQGGDLPGDDPKGPLDGKRPGAGGQRPGAGGRVAVVLAVCLGLVAGAWGVGRWPGGEEDRAGGSAGDTGRKAPAARPAVAWTVPAVGDDEGPGAWGLGDAVVHGRLDGLTAYDARDGRPRWTLAAPTRQAVCSMSPRADRNVGLIAYGRHGRPCATLVAVHTVTGEVLWRRPVGGDGVTAKAVVVGGAVAVAAEDRAVRGRTAGSGEQRWQRALGKDCGILAVDASEAHTLLVEQCGKGARLIALDTATGREQWIRALPVESDATARVVSVEPAVVAVHEADDRGTSALFGFDDSGMPTATVPLSGPDGTVVAFDHDRPLVLGDLLVARVERSSSSAKKTVAYSLENGAKVWEHAVPADGEDGEVTHDALARQPDGGVGVLVRTLLTPKVVLLDPATGRVRAERAPEGMNDLTSIYPELLPVTGGHVVVNHISMSGEPGLFAIR